jgi:transposase
MGHDGKWHGVTAHYCDGERDTVRIRCDNGAELEASEVHRIMTPDGWRTMSELSVGDWVATRVSRTNWSDGGQQLPKLVYRNKKYIGRYKDIVVPTKMSVELASLLGALCADGHLEERTGLISLIEKNNVVGGKYKELFACVFGYEPKAFVDKRTGCTSWNFNSIPLCMWIADLIGHRSNSKHVPPQILMGSKKEQMAFLGGVSLDGYKVECPKSSLGESTVLYDGKSRWLAEEIFAMCVSLGLVPYRGKKRVKSHGYYTHNVRIRGFLHCWETHKNTKPGVSEYVVRLPSADELQAFCPTSDSCDSKYQNIKKWIRNKTKLVRNTVLQRYNIPYHAGVKFVKITDISYGVAELYDIEVEEAHSYTVNGIISHNTINMPPTATQADIAKSYKLAHKLGCKGTTIFREGSKAGVLSVVSAEDKYHEELRRWLRTKFSREGLSAREISDLLGVSEQLIFAKLKRYGIRKEEHETALQASQKQLDESLREIILANILVGHSRLTTVDHQSSYRQVTDHMQYAHSVRKKFLDRGIQCGEIMTIVTDKTYYYFDTCFMHDIYDLPIDFDSVVDIDSKKALRELIAPYFMRHLFLVGGVKTGKGGIKFTSNSRNAEVLIRFMELFSEAAGIEVNIHEESAYIPKSAVDDFYSFLEGGADVSADLSMPVVCPECGGELISNEKCNTCPSCGWGACAI